MIFYNDIFESKERKRKEYSIQRKIRQTILESRSSSRLEEEAEYDDREAEIQFWSGQWKKGYLQNYKKVQVQTARASVLERERKTVPFSGEAVRSEQKKNPV